MIKNYITITLRNFLRNRNYTIINILGLSIGITCCVIIFLLIRYDLDFDKFHSKADQIYRVVHDSENASGIDYSGVTPYPVADAFRNDFPDVPLVTQIHKQGEGLIKIGAEKRLVDDIIFADSLFFSVFDFKVLSGNPLKDLGQPGKVFLTESMAKKLLKGKHEGTLKLNNLIELEVAGILQDPPADSHIQFSMVISMASLSKELLGFAIDQWGLNSSGYTYIVLPESITKDNIESRFKDFVAKYYVKETERKQTYFLQPLAKIHFDPKYNDNVVEKSDLIILGVLGIFILSIACINFINLATALAIKKSKEIGVRKTLGAKRSQLTRYFLGETFILTLFAVLLSLGIVEWLMPWLNNFLDKKVNLFLFTDSTLLFFLISITIFVTVFSGLYPALVLSRYNPAIVLKSKITSQGNSGNGVRRVLVVFQFLIAQILIIGTLIIADQMKYFRSKPLGFAKEAIINVSMPDNKPEVFEAFKSRLLANKNILDLSYSIGAPIADGSFSTGFFLSDQNSDQRYDVSLKLTDFNYQKIYNLKLIAGRWTTENEDKASSAPLEYKDRKYALVVNEAVVKKLGFSNPEEIIGKNITIGLNDISAPVVGVVKDFHIKSLHQEISPVVVLNFPHFYNDAGIKISTTDIKGTIKFIEQTWNALHPDYYFQYEFLDDHLAGLYRQEERTFSLFKIFSGVSIFIGCLGLYGLISFMAQQKLKEIGIRKVMGASVTSIVILFSKEFIRLIVIAFAIAAPIAWYAMNKWLQGFAYRMDINWTVFVISILSTLAIALITVGYRSIRAALSNPVETLRTE
jgi:putative ABC transport system permease protein